MSLTRHERRECCELAVEQISAALVAHEAVAPLLQDRAEAKARTSVLRRLGILSETRKLAAVRKATSRLEARERKLTATISKALLKKESKYATKRDSEAELERLVSLQLPVELSRSSRGTKIAELRKLRDLVQRTSWSADTPTRAAERADAVSAWIEYINRGGKFKEGAGLSKPPKKVAVKKKKRR